METTNLSGITCHIIINGADLPTIYWGEMENRTESMKKVLALCEDVKCNYVIFEVQDWNSAFSPWKFELSKKQSFSGGGLTTLEWLMNECIPHCESEYSLSGKRMPNDAIRTASILSFLARRMLWEQYFFILSAFTQQTKMPCDDKYEATGR